MPEPLTIDDLVRLLYALIERATTADRRFLTIDGAAVYTGLSPESIRRLLSGGKLTALRPVRGRVVIDRNALDAYVLGSDTRPRHGRGRR